MLFCSWTSEKRKRLTKCYKARPILPPKCQKLSCLPLFLSSGLLYSLGMSQCFFSPLVEKLQNSVWRNWVWITESDSLRIIGRWPPPWSIDQEATHLSWSLDERSRRFLLAGEWETEWWLAGWMKHCNELAQPTVQNWNCNELSARSAAADYHSNTFHSNNLQSTSPKKRVK